MTHAHIDFETRSAVDLRKTGVYPYSEDPSTSIWCAAYAADDGPVLLWTPDSDEGDLKYLLKHCETATGHNANFERMLHRGVLAPRFGIPELPIEKWRCTMAQALAMSLPGSLDNAAAALGIDMQKDPKAYASMIRMSKPRKTLSDGSHTWWAEPERLDQLYAYCKADVVQERELGKRLLPLRPAELKLWHLDQAINDRGVHVDTKLCHAAKKIVKATQEKLDKKMCEMTDWEVRSCSAVGQLTAFCRAHGVDTDSVAKDQIDILLARDDLPDDVRAALELRKLGSRASVAKIDALLIGMSNDGRAKGLLQFHAASTGRWGGRRYQPQNLIRPQEGVDIDEMIDDVMTGDVDLIEMLYGDPLTAVANCLRGMVRAG